MRMTLLWLMWRFNDSEIRESVKGAETIVPCGPFGNFFGCSPSHKFG